MDARKSVSTGGGSMFLDAGERHRLEKLLEGYETNPHVQEMRNYIQHGNVTTFDHCMNVVYASFWLNWRLRLHADEKILATGAFLHDFYLYDWHVPEDYHRLHGFSHAETASRNAVEFFCIGTEEQQVIESHMWPLNITRIPKSREAVIVCVADKFCSVLEIFVQRKKGFRICG